MSLLEIVMALQGFTLGKAEQSYADMSRKKDVNLKAWQNKKRWEIVRHHWECNPVFRGKLPNFPERWENVPIMSKKDFQRPIAELLTRPFRKSQVYCGNTSGSSGHPFFYAKDKLCHALTWIQIKSLYAQHGLHFNSRQARFYGMPLNGPGYWKEKAKDVIAKRVRFPVFDLSEPVLESWVQKFSRLQFDYLYGYTSSLVYFARFCRDSGNVLKKRCPALKCCVVTSEVCTPEDRLILEEGFGVAVITEYGASETGLIAFEDVNGRWKLCTELLYIEAVSDKGSQVPFGQPGNLLVTVLFNKAMPLIRYQIGDTGIIEQSKNGQLFLKSLEGRTNDFVRLPSGGASPGLTFYYISRKLLENAGFINEFIIKQTALDTLEFVINAKRPLTEPDKALIQSKLDEYLEPGLHLVIREVDHIERPGSGKIKHFYSEL